MTQRAQGFKRPEKRFARRFAKAGAMKTGPRFRHESGPGFYRIGGLFSQFRATTLTWSSRCAPHAGNGFFHSGEFAPTLLPADFSFLGRHFAGRSADDQVDAFSTASGATPRHQLVGRTEC